MPRKLRVQYPGAIYYVMSRGDRGERIFRSAKDRELFLETLGRACEKTEWQVHAWCLMNDHFHLVIETPRANLVAGMKWLMGTYTIKFNRRHKVFGHLVSGRYKALPVDGSGAGYLRSACDYVHLNPARAKLLSPRQALSAFPWSSYPQYLKGPRERPPWLLVDRLLGEHGVPRDSAAGRRLFRERMEVRRAADDGQEFRPFQRGWYVGGKDFRQELLAQMAGAEHFGQADYRSNEQEARRHMTAELKKRGWTRADLKRRRKGDPDKVQIAMLLRRETTMTLSWIAQALRTGTPAYLAHLLYLAWEKEKVIRR